MRQIIPILVGSVFLAHGAGAQTWSVISFSASPLDAPKVVQAVDAFMASDPGKQFPGKLLLQGHVADGTNPATHSLVPIYKTAAEREAFVQKIQITPAWNQLMGVMTEVTTPASTQLYQVVKSWGDLNDTDHVWMVHAFRVSDAAAFLGAIESFLASPTGQTFPGQVYLSAVVAAGLSPVSHVISVGYDSEAEMAAWVQKRDASQDWQKYIDASQEASEYLGASLARDAKTWGPATMKQLAAR